MNRKEYENFCESIVNEKMYDGRGTYDLYECMAKHDPKMYPGIPTSVLETMPTGCGEKIITTYAVKGVTPFTIKCPKCGATMQHTHTFSFVPENVTVQKWVRPTYEQYCKLSKGAKEHIENGGLLLETYLENI